MFWRFGGYATISSIDSLLDKPDVTVEELLDESDLIQELKQQNSKLVEFLRGEPVLQSLLDYVVSEKPSESDTAGEDAPKKDDPAKSRERPTSASSAGGGISFFGNRSSRTRSKSRNLGDGETEQERKETQRKKYAYVACEVLSSEVWSITEALLEHDDYLRAFWKYVYRPAPLDALQAGYFTKVNETLLDKKTEAMLALFKSLDGIVPAMLQHVDCPMVMDLLLKIISLEKHEAGAGIVDWLQSQQLIPLLLGYLSPEHSSATQTSAGDFLKAIITISANATTQDQSVIGPNELTRQLVSDSCIKSLIEVMLRGGNALTVGVGIVIEVIRKNNSDYDMENQAGPEPKASDPIYLGSLLRQFANNVPNFMHLIRSRSAAKPDLKAAFGGKIEPLGFDRFKTCELMAELLHCSNMGLLNERGAEEEVARRDAQREKLKEEGKLATPQASGSPGPAESFDEFGSSVDSHGFHHAERPTDDEMSEKSDEGQRLETQNAYDEDGFEKVTAPSVEDLPDPDEVSFDDLDEKIEQTGLPTLEKVGKRDPTSPSAQSPADADVPLPLSPSKAKTSLPHFDPPPTQAADSPNTTVVIDRIDKLDVDEDTVMTEFGEEPSGSDDDGSSELERELAKHPEDTPAPLFARRSSSTKDPREATASTEAEQHEVSLSVATLQGGQSAADGERAVYEVETDGNPVVGDLLKVQFVEHHVVPTILDFFFRFPWNNFLHNVVYDVVQQVFNGTLDRGYNRTLAFDLFRDVGTLQGVNANELGLASLKDITERILDGQRASDLSQANKGMRLGYMGHLTLIAEEVCKFGNRQPPESLDTVVHERATREEWVQYVEGILSETRDRDNAPLGGARPQDSLANRNMSVGGSGAGAGLGFSNNTSNALANAGITPQDTLAMSEGTVGQSFEINSGMMDYAHGDEDDDGDAAMEYGGSGAADGNMPQKLSISTGLEPRQADDGEAAATTSAFSDDEQDLPPSTLNASNILNQPPSRARRQLAQRLALRKRAQENAGETDHDDPLLSMAATATAKDRSALLQSHAQQQLVTGTSPDGSRTGPARFNNLFRDDEKSDDEDEGEAAFYGRVAKPPSASSDPADQGSSSSGEEDERDWHRGDAQYGDAGATAHPVPDEDIDDDDDEGEAGRDFSLDQDEEDADEEHTDGAGRGTWTRPCTQEVRGSRRLLDDEVEDEDEEADGRGREGRFVGRYDFRSEGPDDEREEESESSSDSSEDEMVEIRTKRRTA